MGQELLRLMARGMPRRAGIILAAWDSWLSMHVGHGAMSSCAHGAAYSQVQGSLLISPPTPRGHMATLSQHMRDLAACLRQCLGPLPLFVTLLPAVSFLPFLPGAPALSQWPALAQLSSPSSQLSASNVGPSCLPAAEDSACHLHSVPVKNSSFPAPHPHPVLPIPSFRPWSPAPPQLCCCCANQCPGWHDRISIQLG